MFCCSLNNFIPVFWNDDSSLYHGIFRILKECNRGPVSGDHKFFNYLPGKILALDHQIPYGAFFNYWFGFDGSEVKSTMLHAVASQALCRLMLQTELCFKSGHRTDGGGNLAGSFKPFTDLLIDEFGLICDNSLVETSVAGASIRENSVLDDYGHTVLSG